MERLTPKQVEELKALNLPNTARLLLFALTPGPATAADLSRQIYGHCGAGSAVARYMRPLVAARLAYNPIRGGRRFWDLTYQGWLAASHLAEEATP